MIDSHAHLHHPQLANDLEGVIKRFAEEGGSYIVNSAIDLESSHIVLEQAGNYHEILPTLGIHPEVLVPGSDVYISSVNEGWIKKNIDVLEGLIAKHPEVTAIGECGLDYYWVKSERLSGSSEIFSKQKLLFTKQIELALKFGLPMIIHCRDENGDKQCEAEILEILAKEGKGHIRGIFHSYTGSKSYLEDILALGYYVSFNAILTYKTGESVRELLDMVPDERLLIESDAPLLSPQKRRSAGIKIGEPAFVDEVADFIAKRKSYTKEKLWSIVESNFKRLFAISQ
ncbi:TatD family hydrolase [Candidatus Dojkabacteria bacterium]|nr:TatD family hydrolase [Candidatus Dojkabacteria bacterium]